MSYAICSAFMFWKEFGHGWSCSLLPHGGSQCRGADGVEMDLKKVGYKSMGWFNLAQGMDKWLAVWIKKCIIQFLTLWGIYWLADDLLASEVRLCSAVLVGYLVSEMSSEG